MRETDLRIAELSLNQASSSPITSSALAWEQRRHFSKLMSLYKEGGKL